MTKIEFEKLTIHEVEAFYKNISEFMKSGKNELILDFGKVKKIDISAIQLLLCIKKSNKLIIKNLSIEVVEAINIAGCKDYLLGVNND